MDNSCPLCGGKIIYKDNRCKCIDCGGLFFVAWDKSEDSSQFYKHPGYNNYDVLCFKNIYFKYNNNIVKE